MVQSSAAVSSHQITCALDSLRYAASGGWAWAVLLPVVPCQLRHLHFRLNGPWLTSRASRRCTRASCSSCRVAAACWSRSPTCLQQRTHALNGWLQRQVCMAVGVQGCRWGTGGRLSVAVGGVHAGAFCSLGKRALELVCAGSSMLILIPPMHAVGPVVHWLLWVLTSLLGCLCICGRFEAEPELG